jgi:hypothetical protein
MDQNVEVEERHDLILSFPYLPPGSSIFTPDRSLSGGQK